MNLITTGFCLHRPEMVPVIARVMETHDVIFLEEPPAPGFIDMLNTRLDVEEYLMPMDLEYPEFSRRMCRVEQDLHARGKQLIQVEPFIEALLSIHEFLVQGNRPEDIAPDSLLQFVYQAEKNATAALLSYYRTAVTGSFEHTVSSVRQFARADAARFRLRDSLRAQEIARQADRHQSIFVEAGMIHFYLWQQLWRKLKGVFRVQPVFLDRTALQLSNPHHHTYSPGDQLTLAYVFHPGLCNDKWESLMAARSIIYSKIVQKEENLSDSKAFFHLTDEIDCIRTVRMLTLRDCRILYPLIRHAVTAKARLAVADHVTTHYQRRVLL
ncbi:MAG: hypothetical protein U5K27_09425 [Desulfotignum sp.]|nr:hypothetical protein [Desulfotignum sp.]